MEAGETEREGMVKMARLIDADSFKERLLKGAEEESIKVLMSIFGALIDAEPTVDVVPVERCNDRKGILSAEEFRPRTNGDHVRSMTDEELSGIITMVCLGCVVKNCNLHNFGSFGCQEKIMEWLKQPYDGE